MLLYNVNPYHQRRFVTKPYYRFSSNHTDSLKPRIDIIEDETNFNIVAELAGIDKKDISISVDKDNVLTIKGERNFTKDEHTTILRNEITKGKFERKFELPSEIKKEEIKAKFDNGLVLISIPKAEEVKAKEIELELA